MSEVSSESRTALCGVEPVKWVNGCSSAHYILLVGEGDFSFSLSLATSFGSASKLVATSLDSEDDLVKKYSRARSNVNKLSRLGATVLHGVDATVMNFHPCLRMQKFDRIVFNFPHAGFKGREEDLHMIRLHQKLVRKFFCHAGRMLRPHGEIHVSHKTTAPFCDWGIEQLAASSSLGLIDSAVFNIADYPGYHNKRGDGGRCDLPFPIGKSSTYKFTITEPEKKRKKKRRNKSHSNSCGEPNEQALFEASKKSQWIPLSKEEVRIGTHCNTCDESEKQVVETSQGEPRIDLVDKRVDIQGLRNEREDETKCDEADEQLVFEYLGERQGLPLDKERKLASNQVLGFTTFGEIPDKLAFEFAREKIGGGVVNKSDYPGYSNERGGGQRCDEQFAVVKSRTCTFTIGDRPTDAIGNTNVNGQVFCSFKCREMMHLHQPSSEISAPLDARCLLIRHGLMMNREHPISGISQGSVSIQCPAPSLSYHVCNESRGIFMGDRSRHYESIILRRGSFRELMLWSLDCKYERLLTLSGI